MDPTVEPIGNPVKVGEGPIWDSESQSLYFVDIFGGTVNKYNPKTKKHVSAKVGEEHCSLIIQVENEKNKFIISQGNDLHLITWDGESDVIISKELFLKVEQSNEGTKLNDGKVDPAGRLWIGSIGPQVEGKVFEWVPGKGGLYRVNKDRSISKQLKNITLSNGLVWSPDKKKFYFIDTMKYKIDSYDYNDDMGDITNEKTVFDLKANKIEGFLDGMTIDVEGNLWVAVVLGARILKINPTTGELLSTVKFPSLQITSACFGGPNYNELYVTSANVGLTESQLAEYPHAGKCFRVTNLGVKGFPSLPVKI